MLETVELNPTQTISHSIIWLHGLGADGHDFVSLAPELPQTQTRYIFPHAPVRSITANGGFPMRGWYDITGFDEVGLESDRDGIEESIVAINALIDNEIKRGVAEENIIIAGFSQGGAIALCLALHRPRIKAALALSTYLLFADDIKQASSDSPIMIMHGNQDPIVPFHLGKEAYQHLKIKQYAVDFKEYEMAHQLCAMQVVDIDSFLRQQGCL